MDKEDYLESLFQALTSGEVDALVVKAGISGETSQEDYQEIVAAGETRKAAIEKRAPQGTLEETIDETGAEVSKEIRQRRSEREEQEVALVEVVPLENRGTEARIQEFLGARRLDAIIEASSDGLGEGVLYHDLKKQGLWPSADLVDMITADMGQIQESIVKVEKVRLTHPDGKESWDVYEATVEAIDGRTGKRVVAQATEVIDWAELKKGRSFAKRKAIRKAARNAKLGLIPVPRKALCTLIRRVVREYKMTAEEV